jgi:hypothetical protein
MSQIDWRNVFLGVLVLGGAVLCIAVSIAGMLA